LTELRYDNVWPSKYTPTEREAILAWFQKHWPEKNRHCPICETRGWVVEDLLTGPVGTTKLETFGHSHFLVPVGCANCGYTILFDAGKFGIMPPREDIDG